MEGFEKELDLSCPCMPQCPNYGKCRVCIATHARFNTPPKCVKMMQENMKKNHLHPVNPHVKQSLTERIKLHYEAHPSSHLREISRALKITDWQLLDAHDDAISVPTSELDAILDELSELGRVLLHLDTGAVVTQISARLPKKQGMGDVDIIKTENDEISLTSLILKQDVYALFLVREALFGKESMSLAIVDESESIALSIYLPREGDQIETKAKRLFERLWDKYKNN